MSNTSKGLSERDANQTLRSAYNEIDGSMQISGFLTSKVGAKVTLNSVSEVQTISFYDNGTLLYTLTLTYTDSSQATLVSAERTA